MSAHGHTVCVGGEAGAALWDLRRLSGVAQPQPYADLLTIPERHVRPKSESVALTLILSCNQNEVHGHAGSEAVHSFAGLHGHEG